MGMPDTINGLPVRTGCWEPAEDAALAQWQAQLGNRWAAVARNIPGRTGQQCAQRWRHRVNPDIRKDKWTAAEDGRLTTLVRRHGCSWAAIARGLKGRTDQQCMGRWRRHLDPAINRAAWTAAEDAALIKQAELHGSQWAFIAQALRGRTSQQCRARYFQLDPRNGDDTLGPTHAAPALKRGRVTAIGGATGRRRKRRRIVYSYPSESDCSADGPGRSAEAAVPGYPQGWDDEVGWGVAAGPIGRGSFRSTGSGRSAGSSRSTGTAAAVAARRQSLASVKLLSGHCAADASDESDSEQKCERLRGKRESASKLHGQDGREDRGDPRLGAPLREGPRADAAAGQGLRAGGRAACPDDTGELSPPLFKNAQRGCRSRPGALGGAATERARGTCGGAGASWRTSKPAGSPDDTAAAAVGESAQRSALQLRNGCRSEGPAAAGRPSVLWGRASSPSPERELLLQQEDFLFSPRRPCSNAKKQRPLPITPLRPLPPAGSFASAAGHFKPVQSPRGLSSAKVLCATAHWQTPPAELSLQSPEGSCQDTLFAQPRAITPSADARRRCSDVSQDSGEAPPTVAAHGLCHAFLGSRGAMPSNCSSGGAAAAAAAPVAAEACSCDFLLQDTPLKGMPLPGMPFSSVGGSSDLALCSPDGNHILGLLASPLQPRLGGQSDLGSPFDFRMFVSPERHLGSGGCGDMRGRVGDDCISIPERPPSFHPPVARSLLPQLGAQETTPQFVHTLLGDEALRPGQVVAGCPTPVAPEAAASVAGADGGRRDAAPQELAGWEAARLPQSPSSQALACAPATSSPAAASVQLSLRKKRKGTHAAQLERPTEQLAWDSCPGLPKQPDPPMQQQEKRQQLPPSPPQQPRPAKQAEEGFEEPHYALVHPSLFARLQRGPHTLEQLAGAAAMHGLPPESVLRPQRGVLQNRFAPAALGREGAPQDGSGGKAASQAAHQRLAALLQGV